jgi:hypothetical protein
MSYWTFSPIVKVLNPYINFLNTIVNELFCKYTTNNVGCGNCFSPGIFIIVVLMEALVMSSFIYQNLWKCKLSFFLLLKPCLFLWMLLIMNALTWTLLPMYTQRLHQQLIQGDTCGSCTCTFAKHWEKISRYLLIKKCINNLSKVTVWLMHICIRKTLREIF